jgi:hypothetical protein
MPAHKIRRKHPGLQIAGGGRVRTLSFSAALRWSESLKTRPNRLVLPQELQPARDNDSVDFNRAAHEDGMARRDGIPPPRDPENVHGLPVSKNTGFPTTEDAYADVVSSVDGESDDGLKLASNTRQTSSGPSSQQIEENTAQYERDKKEVKTSANAAETSGDNSEKPLKNTERAAKNNEKPANHSTTTGSETLKPGEKRKSTELEIIESKVKRLRASDRQARLRKGTAAANALEDNPNDPALEKTIHMQHSRAAPFKVSKTDLTTIRKFVYDKGLVGGSQPELLQELLAQLGVEEDDDDAILGKLKQKVSNVNRTRREFHEMVAEDDVESVKERLVNIFKTFATRPGALGMVKEAIAQVEEFVETLPESEDASSSDEQTDHVAEPAGKIAPLSAMSSSTEEDNIATICDRFGNDAPKSHN